MLSTYTTWILPQQNGDFWCIDVIQNNAQRLKAYQLETTITSYACIVSHNAKELIKTYDLAHSSISFICLKIFKNLVKGYYENSDVIIPEFNNQEEALIWVKSTLKHINSFIKKLNIDFLFRLECDLIKVIVKMENLGLPFNKQAWAEELQLLNNEKDSLYKKLLKTLNIDIGFSLFSNKNINLNTIKNSSNNLELNNYREINKLVSVYGDNFMQNIKYGRIRGAFNQLGCSSGRISCQQINLQALPNNPKFQKCIQASIDTTILHFDYAGFELRILAALSQDEKMSEIFLNNKDIHAIVAKKLFNDETLRDQAKIINFGIVYGMGAKTLGSKLNTSADHALELLTNYLDNFSGIKNYLLSLETQAFKNNQTKTALNRPLYFLDGPKKTLARNLPIQGTGADIIKLAMLKTDEYLVNNNCQAYLINTIHDELVIECQKTHIDLAKSLVIKAMKEAFRTVLKSPIFEAKVTV
jgi:DNA polymerase-1